VFLVLARLAFANPAGPTVIRGVGEIQGLGTSEVTIHQNDVRAILNWQQFDIAPNEVTRFIQPTAQSIVLNRIFDQNPSQILGSLVANGSVILLNPNGVLFGPEAQVNVNGLIASSLDLKNEDFLNGQYRFGVDEGTTPRGTMTNQGTIEAGPGGVYLFAPNVSNSGIIRSQEGEILLAAGATVYLSQRPDGRGFLWEVSNTNGAVANLGSLIADDGKIGLSGWTVRQAGLIQANSVRERNGRIELVASEQVRIERGSQTLAAGGAEGVSAGGVVIAGSDKMTGSTHFEEGAMIDTSGGSEGGDGGFVELSGSEVTLGGTVRGLSQPGYRGGRFLLDPYDLQLDDLVLSQLSSVLAQDIDIQADHDIHVVAPAFDLSAWPTNGFAERTLSFQAGNDLNFTQVFWFNGIDPAAPGIKWNIKGNAGNDILFTEAQLWNGNGGGFDFQAGRDIRIETDLSASSPSYLWVLAGGDIRLKAARDVIAPVQYYGDPHNRYAGIRLAGIDPLDSTPGSLTIKAGRDFLGGFTLANGTARISAGGNFGRSSVGLYPDFSYANLILGKGTIQVDAKGSVYLGRVQDLGLSEINVAILDPKNAVTLTAETGDIYLNPTGDSEVLKKFQAIGLEYSTYYPPSFTAIAQEGNIIIEKDLTFWPSLTGTLEFYAHQNIRGVISAGRPSRLALVNANPERLPGADASSAVGQGIRSLIPGNPLKLDLSNPDYEPALVRFQTGEGDILNFYFAFKTGLNKQVTISSGRDLKQFTAQLMIPEGTEVALHAGRDIEMISIVDDFGNTISSGVSFYGTGQGNVFAGRDLNLGESQGIQQQLPFDINRIPAGLIDISVGGDLRMTASKIYTYNGASLSIHGTDGPDSPLGGIVDVGTNNPGDSINPDRGIATVGGGSVNIVATGDVNVNASRVATFGGGDIRIASASGNINAGFGGADDVVLLAIPVVQLDPDGNPRIDNNGNVLAEQHFIQVPGSGIFTYHPDDPNPLPPYPPPPTFTMPSELQALQATIIKQKVIGHEIPAFLEAEYNARLGEAVQAWADQYAQIIADFNKDWKLGDITLKAFEGDVDLPPAGIRGRNVEIKAKRLNFLGGELIGNVTIDVDQIIGDQTAISGPLTGNLGGNIVLAVPTGSASAGSLGGLSGSTGSVSTTTVSAATTVAEAVNTVQEQAAEQRVAQSDTGGGQGTGADSKKSKKKGSVRLKRGVTIEVEVKEEKP
jgi:filamentous hemagglutinin family protein